MAIEIPHPDDIRDTFEQVRQKIGRMYLNVDGVIDDYPIGRRDRGKCRLQVERAKGKGYRTVRTTTNKQGRWCAPKKSTYRNAIYVVASNVDSPHRAFWLSVGQPHLDYGGAHVCLTYPNGDGLALAKCWRSYAPNREERRYTITTSSARLIIGRDGVRPVEEKPAEREEHVDSAASPEEIAAWDL
jgi:hypothetical protein